MLFPEFSGTRALSNKRVRVDSSRFCICATPRISLASASIVAIPLGALPGAEKTHFGLLGPGKSAEWWTWVEV